MKTFNLILISYLLAIPVNSFAMDFSKALCSRDLRAASDYAPVMRLRSSLEEQELSCTGFLISNSCALTAGHCESSAVLAEFNVPDGDGAEFSATASDERDVYEVDRRRSETYHHRTGADFSVLRLKKNSITGHYPGEVQGHFEMQNIVPKVQEEVRIVGFGASYSSREKFLSQKTDLGVVVSTNYRRGYPFIPTLSSVTYSTGSTGGDSGAPIILESTGKVIGIHNAGSCMHRAQRNSGTLFEKQDRLQKAIERCLREEEQR